MMEVKGVVKSSASGAVGPIRLGGFSQLMNF